VLATLVFRFRSLWFLWLAPLNLTEENVAAVAMHAVSASR
jgi:hypothetical protein